MGWSFHNKYFLCNIIYFYIFFWVYSETFLKWELSHQINIYIVYPLVNQIVDRTRTQWKGNVGPLESEWAEILENTKKTSSRLSDPLTQLYIIHRAYLTPLRILKYCLNYNPLCSRCAGHSCTLFYLMWTCPEIQNYWAQIVKFLNDHMGSPLQTQNGVY